MVKVFVSVSCVLGFVFVLVSSTSTVKVDETAVVLGVPEITPVFLFNLSPLGKDPIPLTTFQVYGGLPPLAANVAEYL
jgi:hypothetical protein